jgi:putative membrane protein
MNFGPSLPVQPLLASVAQQSLSSALLATAAFGVVGIILSLVGFKLFDWMVPVCFSKELEKGNVAVGILCGAIVIGVCLVIAAALT